MRLRTAISLLLCLAVTPLLVIARQQTPVAPGEIRGVVRDLTGAPLPGVTVDLLQNGTTVLQAVTSADGTFTIAGVKPGRYTLSARLSGFETQQRPIALGASAGLSVAFELGITAMAEAVTIDGRIPGGSLGGVVGGLPSAAAARSAGVAGPGAALGPHQRYRALESSESYARVQRNGFRLVANEPLSTFAADVDTASYANVRRFLNEGRLPPEDAVRIEELINYFRFDYAAPREGEAVGLSAELSTCPWEPKHKLVLLGLKTPAIDQQDLPQRNLVFLLDVSGSMQSPDKLPLVRSAMRMFVDTLRPQDRVAIVVYAGATGVALPSTPASHRARIHDAIEALHAGGSTNGGAGIRLAYQIAREQFVEGGVNRVILATDGDFNVGTTSHGELMALIETERRSGVVLSVLGVGTGNIKDSTMEMLADKGNGNYSYLDSLLEARKVLVSESGATLQTVAKDVKIQIEFNPGEVAAYRLIGYENRLLANEDFNDDTKDAGEMGAGHTVTALYEIVPKGVEPPAPGGGPAVNPLVYQTGRIETPRAGRGELLTFSVRYKEPDGEKSRLVTTTAKAHMGDAAHLPFASAVAEFAMLLRGDLKADASGWQRVAARVRDARGNDADGYRAELARLIELAAGLKPIATTRKQP
jgi:Ca-activated chloride channel family protein